MTEGEIMPEILTADFSCPLPNEFDKELLVKLMEECGEITQAAAKLYCFGADSGYPGCNTTNAQDLGRELGNLIGVAKALVKTGVIDNSNVALGIASKLNKLPNYMLSAPPGYENNREAFYDAIRKDMWLFNNSEEIKCCGLIES